MTSSLRAAGLALATASLAGCVAVAVTPPQACSYAAADHQGAVAAFYSSTVAAIRRIPTVGNNAQLAGYADQEPATICYIDWEVPTGPPPSVTGTVPPPLDRAVIVVVGDKTIDVTIGYQANLPTQAP